MIWLYTQRRGEWRIQLRLPNQGLRDCGPACMVTRFSSQDSPPHISAWCESPYAAAATAWGYFIKVMTSGAICLPASPIIIMGVYNPRLFKRRWLTDLFKNLREVGV
jgi:hypothetical protein